MKRSAAISIGLTAALAMAVAGCSSEDEQEHTAVCVDEQTQQRVDDDVCDDDRDHHGFVWFYYPHTYSAPPVGGRINPQHGTYTKPAGPITTVPKSGGFGGSKAGTGTGSGS